MFTALWLLTLVSYLPYLLREDDQKAHFRTEKRDFKVQLTDAVGDELIESKMAVFICRHEWPVFTTENATKSIS